jgi:hypothetical protein
VTAAQIRLHVPGARVQTLGVFDLEVRGKTEENALVVGVEDVLRGLAGAMRNQVDGLRLAGIPEETITGLLIDVWPFKAEETS